MYEYEVEIVRVIDGDTVDVMIDLGFNVWSANRLRLIGIDAPETRTRDPEEKILGFAAKEELERLIYYDDAKSFYIKSHELDKYGRSLATLYSVKEDMTINLNEHLLANGFVSIYR